MIFRRQLGRVAVYCASNPGCDPAFPRLAAELGAELARRGIELVYGGSDAGLMRIVASSVLANGGRVTGVHPEGHPIEAPQRDLTRLCVVKSMAERKAKMLELADAWLALPGGFGTLDEFFDAICLLQLGIHRKPCGLLNIHGYYDHLLAFLNHAEFSGLLKPEHRRLINVSASPAELIDMLATRAAPALLPAENPASAAV